jgi:hypothetical protein
VKWTAYIEAYVEARKVVKESEAVGSLARGWKHSIEIVIVQRGHERLSLVAVT